MTGETDHPDVEVIDAAIERLALAAGKTPSVLTLARNLGLANTTFRRRYPDVVERLRASNRVPAAPDTGPRLVDSHIIRLQQRNRELTDHLELAVASIQRLSIDIRSLRLQLEDATAVTRLSRGP